MEIFSKNSGMHKCLHLGSDYVFKRFLGSWGPCQLWCADTCSTLHTPHTFGFLDTRKALGLKVFKQTNVCSVSLCRHGEGFVDVLPPSRKRPGQCTAWAAAAVAIIIHSAPCPWARPTFVFISQISRHESSCMNLLSTGTEEQEKKKKRKKRQTDREGGRERWERKRQK